MGISWSVREQQIYDFFKSKGFCDNGIFGLMGNLYAESGMNPKNLQNSYEERLGFTDKSYTAAVDNGTYKNFVHDSAGYGLAQWTFWARKELMLEFHHLKGKSIGDLQTQCEFLYMELDTRYPTVLEKLKNANTILEASNAVLLGFERPADQSITMQEKRARFGQKYANLHGGEKGKEYSRSVIVDIMLGWKGASEGSTAHKEILSLYNSINPLPRGVKMLDSYAWCAATWSAAAVKAGYTDIIPLECSCYYLIEKAKAMGIWVENDNYIPSPGDGVLYDWQDSGIGDNTGMPDHIGMVWKVDGNTIYVIEGNLNNRVGIRQISVNGKYIRGYICPRYTDSAPVSAEPEFFQRPKTYRNGSTPETVYSSTTAELPIGELNPREECKCFCTYNGMACVAYKVDGMRAMKAGWVKWLGGIVN